MARSLAFVGCNIGADVDREVDAHEACWLFEPIPEVASALLERYSARKYMGKAITIVNAACYSDTETRPFNLYNINGLSSSLGRVTDQASELFVSQDLSLIDTIDVPCVMLSQYLPLWLDTLIVDAQGADLAILQTIEPWLQHKRIGRVQVECDGDGFRHYSGLSDNSESSLLEYMSRFDYSCSRVPEKIDENPDWMFTRNCHD